MSGPPVPASPIPWLASLRADPARVNELIERWGSPLHLHRPDVLPTNARPYFEAAATHGVDLDLFFARKANKALAYVEVAAESRLGVDVASETELQQCLALGIEGPRIVVTAAVKSPSLLRRAAGSGACVVIDHPAEIPTLREMARALPTDDGPTEIALRLRGFPLLRGRHNSRFGIDLDEIPRVVDSLVEAHRDGLHTVGLHFHLDGYDALDRAEALDRSIHLAEALRHRGLPIRFIDMGGGFPTSYTARAADWNAFLTALDRALLGDRPSITFGNNGFGRFATEGALVGRPAVYPHHQSLTGREWMDRILSHRPAASGSTLAESLVALGLQLRAEPGRALLDGCGATLARVEFVKPGQGSTVFVGVAMNSSNCRSRKSPLLTDPLLISHSHDTVGEPAEGFVVGAYCAEDDLISPRLLRFADGIAAGDVLAFPNTAGYYMHFVESRSHQFPLPLNVVLGPRGEAALDAIDHPGPRTKEACP